MAEIYSFLAEKAARAAEQHTFDELTPAFLDSLLAKSNFDHNDMVRLCAVVDFDAECRVGLVEHLLATVAALEEEARQAADAGDELLAHLREQHGYLPRGEAAKLVMALQAITERVQAGKAVSLVGL